MPTIEQVARLLCCSDGQCEAALRKKFEDKKYITQMPCGWQGFVEPATKMIELFAVEKDAP